MLITQPTDRAYDRDPEFHRFSAESLHIRAVRRRDSVLADRLQRRQYPQSGSGDDRRVSLSGDRAGAAADPRPPAEFRRHRRVLHRGHPDHLFHPAGRPSHPGAGFHLVTAAQRPWAACADGLLVSVRLTPRGGRDQIEGVELLADGRSVLKARVRAAATEGEANEALMRLLARAAGVAPRAVRLIGGAT